LDKTIYNNNMRTKFYTGKGDSGESRVGRRKISKNNPLFDFLGGLDELNSWLGLCRVGAAKLSSRFGRQIDVARILKEIQESLFIIQAEAAAGAFGYSKSPKISEEKTKYLEMVIEGIDKVVPKIEKFIIPGGSELAAKLDFGRTIARRIERLAKRYNEKKKLSKSLLQFLNRLSSLLFALARYVNFKLGLKEENPSYK